MFSQAKEDKIQHVSGQSNMGISRPAHALSFDTVITEVQANSDDGLTTQEAKQRLEQYGRNELEGDDGVQPIKILLRQVANAMTLVNYSPSYS